MKRIRVLVADDHKAMLDQVVRLLEPEFDVVGTVGDGQALLEAVPRLNPDVLVLDIAMPGLSGLQAARELRKAGSRVKIVFLTIHEESDFVRESFASGGSGYVIKARLGADLVPAIHEALADRALISPPLSLRDL